MWIDTDLHGCGRDVETTSSATLHVNNVFIRARTQCGLKAADTASATRIDVGETAVGWPCLSILNLVGKL
jgi:hypothetical protein